MTRPGSVYRIMYLTEYAKMMLSLFTKYFDMVDFLFNAKIYFQVIQYASPIYQETHFRLEKHHPHHHHCVVN